MWISLLWIMCCAKTPELVWVARVVGAIVFTGKEPECTFGLFYVAWVLGVNKQVEIDGPSTRQFWRNPKLNIREYHVELRETSCLPVFQNLFIPLERAVVRNADNRDIFTPLLQSVYVLVPPTKTVL